MRSFSTTNTTVLLSTTKRPHARVSQQKRFHFTSRWNLLDDVVLFWWVRKGCDWLRFTDAILIGSRRGFDNKGGKSVWSGSGIGEHGVFVFCWGVFSRRRGYRTGAADETCMSWPHRPAREGRRETIFEPLLTFMDIAEIDYFFRNLFLIIWIRFWVPRGGLHTVIAFVSQLVTL